MKIAIVGSGNVGGRLGAHWAKAGHNVVFSSRHPEQLGSLIEASEGKARAARPGEAAGDADVVLLAVPYWFLDDALASAGSLEGKLVIDATNPFTPDYKGFAVPEDTTALAELQKKLPGSKVVKAFNCMGAAVLSDDAFRTDRYVVFVSGDDPSAKAIAAGLINDAGFTPYDLGDSSQVVLHEPRGPLFTKTLTRSEADDFLRGIRAAAAAN